MTRTAHCNCGALRLEADGEPEAVVVCHCTDCQRRTGSVVGVGAYYHKDKVRITGASTAWTRTAHSGRRFTQNFCPTCGTSVFFISDNKPDGVGVAVGAFADPNYPAPARSVWERSQHPWIAVPEDHVHFDMGRDQGAKKA